MDRRNTLSLREKMECDDGSEILSWFQRGRENGVVGALAARGVAESDWAGVWQAVIGIYCQLAPRCCVDRLRPPSNSGQTRVRLGCPLCANNGLMQRSKKIAIR